MHAKVVSNPRAWLPMLSRVWCLACFRIVRRTSCRRRPVILGIVLVALYPEGGPRFLLRRDTVVKLSGLQRCCISGTHKIWHAAHELEGAGRWTSERHVSKKGECLGDNLLLHSPTCPRFTAPGKPLAVAASLKAMTIKICENQKC